MPTPWSLPNGENFALPTTRKFLQYLQRFAISIDTDGLHRVFAEVFDYARRYQRTAYDASYLQLAMRRNLPLATKDAPLRKAAEETGRLDL